MMKELEQRIRKFTVFDILLIVITGIFLALIVAILNPDIISKKYFTMWLILLILAAAKPLYSLFFKK